VGGQLICRGGPIFFFKCGTAGEQTRAGGASTLAGGAGPPCPPPDATGLNRTLTQRPL